jgi:hypothetical protein
MALTLTGCSTTQSALVCFAPERPFEYQPGRRLRDKFILLTRQDLRDDDFTCYPSDDGLICWVVLHDAAKVPTVKAALKSDREFRLLSVGYVDPDDVNLFAMVGKGPAPPTPVSPPTR